MIGSYNLVGDASEVYCSDAYHCLYQCLPVCLSVTL